MNSLELLQALEDVMHILEIAGTNGIVAAQLTASRAIEKAQRDMDTQGDTQPPKVADPSEQEEIMLQDAQHEQEAEEIRHEEMRAIDEIHERWDEMNEASRMQNDPNPKNYYRPYTNFFRSLDT